MAKDDFRHKCAVAHSGLTDWGEWVAFRIRDEHGLPHDVSFADKVGRSTLKSTIPIKIMPRRIAEISRIVSNLPGNLREALSIHYIFNVSENGVIITVEQRAQWLGLKLRTYQYRVSEGRKEFARRLP